MDVTGKSGKVYDFSGDAENATDEEIHNFLGADSPKTIVRQHLRSLPQKAQASPEPASTAPPEKGFGETAREAAGPIGGMAGSLIGGAIGGPMGATLGAGIGGAAGGGVTAASDTGTVNPQDVLGKMLEQGGQQAILQEGGEQLANLVKAAAKPVMQWALKATPEVAQTALREGIQGTRSGLQKVMDKLGAAGMTAKAIAARADARGVAHSAVGLTSDIEKQAIPDLTGPFKQDDAERIYNLSNKFIKENGPRISNQELIDFRQVADQKLAPIRKLIAKKEPVPADMLAEQKWWQGMADAARSRLNTLEDPGVTLGRVPASRTNNMALANQYTGELAEVRKALAPQVLKEGGLGQRLAGRSIGPGLGAAVGALAPGDRASHGMEGALLGGLATSPVALTLLAHFLNSPMLGGTLAQVPRAGAAALESAH